MLTTDVALSTLASKMMPVSVLLLPYSVVTIVRIWFCTWTDFEVRKSLGDIVVTGRAQDTKTLQDVSKGWTK
jgi:hypothetical protein